MVSAVRDDTAKRLPRDDGEHRLGPDQGDADRARDEHGEPDRHADQQKNEEGDDAEQCSRGPLHQMPLARESSSSRAACPRNSGDASNSEYVAMHAPSA